MCDRDGSRAGGEATWNYLSEVAPMPRREDAVEFEESRLASAERQSGRSAIRSGAARASRFVVDDEKTVRRNAFAAVSATAGAVKLTLDVTPRHRLTRSKRRVPCHHPAPPTSQLPRRSLWGDEYQRSRRYEQRQHRTLRAPPASSRRERPCSIRGNHQLVTPRT